MDLGGRGGGCDPKNLSIWLVLAPQVFGVKKVNVEREHFQLKQRNRFFVKNFRNNRWMIAVDLWTVWLGHDANRTKSCHHFAFLLKSKLFQILNLIYAGRIGKYMSNWCRH